MFHVVFHEPEIPGNTGNAIRMAAGSGCALHLIEPMGFSVRDAQLRRAGLDYHDRAALHVHPALNPLLDELKPGRVVAFTAHAELPHTDLSYAPGDVLLFGRESVGLSEDALDRATDQVRLPMLPGIRSMNLANSAAVAVYEAWRQNDFAVP